MASSWSTNFDVEGGFPGLGTFNLEFRPGTQHILGPHVTRTAEVAGGPTENYKHDTICITSQDLGPNPTRSDVLAASLFSGLAQKFTVPIGADRGWSIGGPSILALLGNADNPGIGPHGITDDATVHTITSLLTYHFVTTNIVNGLTRTAGGSLSSNSLGIDLTEYDTVREQLNKALPNTTVATEYRCTPAGVCIFDARGGTSAFRQTPQVMLTSDPVTMRDGDLWAFQVSGSVEYDYTGEAEYVYTYNAAPWSDSAEFSGRLIYAFDGPVADGGTGNATMSIFLGGDDYLENADLDDYLTNTYRRKERMTLDVAAYSLADYINAGDYVWLNCPEAFLIDPTKTINFAGEETHPVGLRTSALTCPVRSSHGVYVIHNATQYLGNYSVVERLNDYLAPCDDTSPASVELDPMPAVRKLVNGRRYRKGG